MKTVKLILVLMLLFMVPVRGETATLRASFDNVHYFAKQKGNSGHLAERKRFVATVKPSVIYTFGGLSRRSSLEDVLVRLAANGMRATFFVTERELERNADNIDLIAQAGQELGIGLHYKPEFDFFDYCAQIDRIQTALDDRYGTEPAIIRQMDGPLEAPALQEAVSAMGCELYGQAVNVVQSKHKSAKSAEEVMSQLFGKGTISLGRGQIVYIRTDFYDSESLAGDMMLAVKNAKIDNIAYRSFDDAPEFNARNDSAYTIASLGDVLADTGKRYVYPVTDETLVPAELRADYRPFKVIDGKYSSEFFKRYIGSPWVNENDRMLNFSFGDMQQADKTGIVKSVSDNTIFLTFDDWGNDASVNKLLYVLRKHNVQGTFFIITWNVHNNPNLLRAIAVDGNEIGSHTDGHKAMAVWNEKGSQMKPVLSDEEYAADVAEAYKKLVKTVGDVKVNGRYSLTRLFRPPTLAVSKAGIKGVLDAGYTFIVNGYSSTSDYEAPTTESLVGAIQEGIYTKKGVVRSGSVIVMHMSQYADKTARALDIILTANERRSDSDPRKFKVGRLSDYLVEGYDQRMKPLTKNQ